jgi:hypothetical protein
MKIGLMTTPWGNPSGVAHIAQLAKQRRARIHLGGEHSHLPVPTKHAFSSDTSEFYRRFPTPTSP